jgi:ribosomal protein S18 acetylase RimI-like enzyme
MRTAEALVLRPFRPADARFVRALATEAFAEYDGGTGGARVLAMATAPYAHTIVADIADEPAGFAVVTLDDGHAHLGAIAVARISRGVGVGRRLLTAAEDLAASLGAATIRLETGEANLAAIELFVRAGYARVKRISKYYRTGYDALAYRKDLSRD